MNVYIEYGMLINQAMNFTICFHVRLFQDTRRNYIGHVNCSNPSIFTFKRGMSESNLYKLNVVGYFVSVIHKTLKSPPGSINQYIFVRCVLVFCLCVCFLFFVFLFCLCILYTLCIGTVINSLVELCQFIIFLISHCNMCLFCSCSPLFYYIATVGF